MKSFKTLRILFLLLLCTLISNLSAQPFEKPLTNQEIKKWFVASIETQKILWEYQANASNYEDAPLAYGKAKKEWLKNNGWEQDSFEVMSERINGVYNSINNQKDIDQEKGELKDQIAEIENNAYINAEQKTMMKSAMFRTINERQKVVDYFKPDWPAFKPYLEKYKQLDLWISKNRETPPSIE